MLPSINSILTLRSVAFCPVAFFPSGLLSYGLLSVAFCPVAFCTVAFCRGPLFSSERIFENPLRIDKVIAMSWVYYIFGTQCILYVYAYIVCWWTDWRSSIHNATMTTHCVDSRHSRSNAFCVYCIGPIFTQTRPHTRTRRHNDALCLHGRRAYIEEAYIWSTMQPASHVKLTHKSVDDTQHHCHGRFIIIEYCYVFDVCLHVVGSN